MLPELFLYIFITAYVFFAPYYLLTKKYSRQYSFTDRLLAAFVLGVSQIILTEIALGFALRLTSLNLSIFNIVVSTCILILAGIHRKELLSLFKEVGSSLTTLFNLVLRHRVLSIILFLSAVQVFWWTFQVYLFPPYAWDAMSYHLPKVAHILQSSGIEQFEAGRVYVNTYPFNIELLFLWNVIYLGNDILVNGTQILFALAGVLGIYGIARKVGVKPQYALFALIFLFVPIVIQQATTCYIDLSVSAMFVIAVNFLLLKNKPRINLVILGLAVGVMIGAKYTFILPGLIISLILLLLILNGLRREECVGSRRLFLFRKGAVEDFCLYMIPILVVGGIWYIRNYIAYGNPLAPIEVTVFGETLFHGSVTLEDLAQDTPTFTAPYFIIGAWLESSAPGWDHAYYNYDVGRGGFGPMFPILLLPSLVFSLFLAFRKGWKSYLLVAVVFILAFLVVPMNWWSRHTIFLCAFGVLSFVMVMEHLPNTRTIALMAIPIIVLTAFVGNTHPYYTPERIGDFICKPLAERQSSDLCIFCQSSDLCTSCRGDKEIFQILLEEPGATILYTDVPNGLSYYLWDSDFTNTVVNIPKHYANYGELIDHIEEFGDSLILTTVDSDIIEYSDAHRSEFQPVYEKDEWRIIRYVGGDNVQEV